MNYLIQRGKVRAQAIAVPDGLPELLSDITREVLRCQPSKACLCQFIIDYLHSVIVTREKAMVASSILERALRKVDDVIADMCVCDISKEKSDMMARAMEDCFRNFLERRRCEFRRGKEMVHFDDFDMLEELIKKCHFTDFELERSRPALESAYKRFVEAYMAAAEGADGTEVLYQYFRNREMKRIEGMLREQAAIKIQSLYRGYRVRALQDRRACTCTCQLDKEDDQLKQHAALVITQFMRRSVQKTRQKDQGILRRDPCEPESKESSLTNSDIDEAPSDVILGEALFAPPTGVAAPPKAVDIVPIIHDTAVPEPVQPTLPVAAAEQLPEKAPSEATEVAADASPAVEEEPSPALEEEPTALPVPTATEEGAIAASHPPTPPHSPTPPPSVIAPQDALAPPAEQVAEEVSQPAPAAPAELEEPAPE